MFKYVCWERKNERERGNEKRKEKKRIEKNRKEKKRKEKKNRLIHCGNKIREIAFKSIEKWVRVKWIRQLE